MTRYRGPGPQLCRKPVPVGVESLLEGGWTKEVLKLESTLAGSASKLDSEKATKIGIGYWQELEATNPFEDQESHTERLVRNGLEIFSCGTLCHIWPSKQPIIENES
ncbi:hypothetical protein SK128_013714 [Halocaridina rubra]|uniref:Uncharacterized protein n=1 Tax=Halocaridina rubra TaxID=373956 RepID=A0AAN9AH76_HALRR